MKRFTLAFTILCAFFALAYAGTEKYSGKETQVLQPAPPVCEWYRAHEWDFDFWGAYAFSANPGQSDAKIRGPNFDPEPRGGSTVRSVDNGQFNNDRFMDRNSTLGGGADIKYFFSKYWALGAEGFIIRASHNSGGAGLGTFTFRFPIGCSRFAPYAWAGFGALGGGSHSEHLFTERHDGPGEAGEETEKVFNSTTHINNTHTEAIGQFGGGMEFRVTRHIGFMSDFAWNMVGGTDNDFGMARLGVTLSY